jgi:hypothetical protein
VKKGLEIMQLNCGGNRSLGTCGILRSAEWLFLTDVSAQTFGPISNSQNVQEKFSCTTSTLEVETDVGCC